MPGTSRDTHRGPFRVAAAAEPSGSTAPGFEGQRVLVAGATGRTGKLIVKGLQQRGVPVVALVRDEARARETFQAPDGITIIQGDVTKFETLPKAMEGCTSVVNLSATNSFTNPLLPFQVEYQGSLNLIAAAKMAGAKKMVLVTSIGTDEIINPFNLFFGLLFFKKLAEDELQRSGLDYTIVRPSGLVESGSSGRTVGQVVMKPRGHYGFAPGKASASGSILRQSVADICIDALVDPAASNRIVEVATDPQAPVLTPGELFLTL